MDGASPVGWIKTDSPPSLRSKRANGMPRRPVRRRTPWQTEASPGRRAVGSKSRRKQQISELFGWLRVEKRGEAQLGADILLEASHPVEIVEDITTHGKILRERELKLDMAPQVIIFS